jgi:hypothetical protein
LGVKKSLAVLRQLVGRAGDVGALFAFSAIPFVFKIKVLKKQT